MTWFKVDDRFPESDKVIELTLRPEGLAALGVWTLCGAWAAGRGNGGRVTEAVVKRFRGTRKHVAALVAVGLWDASDDEWQFHDWDDYNESAEAAEAVKVAEREAGRRGNHERWHVKRGVVARSCEFCIASPIENTSGGDRVPDTDPESGAIPPGPVPDPDRQIDDRDAHKPVALVDARESDTDEDFIAAEASRLGIKSLPRVRRAFEGAGVAGSDAELIDLTRAVVELATTHVRSVEAYVETTCLKSPATVADLWVRAKRVVA
jgi:hypothetical protein